MLQNSRSQATNSHVRPGSTKSEKALEMPDELVAAVLPPRPQALQVLQPHAFRQLEAARQTPYRLCRLHGYHAVMSCQRLRADMAWHRKGSSVRGLRAPPAP